MNSRFSRRSVLIAIAALVAVAIGIWAMWNRLGAGPSSSTPVILISIDTLRSDHLPAYGYDKVSTPHLDAFRADSILYEHAYSHCPLTLPSHASMLTALLPADHGLRDNVGFALEKKAPTVAELLKKNGYATGAAVSAFVLRRESGIDRGFDEWDDQVEPIGASQFISRVQREGNETLQVAKRWIDAHSARPFFYFLHLYDPHTPYTPPEPFRTEYKDRPYDGEIAYTDQVVGDFLEYLKSKDLYDRSLIIVLSDHGEGLYEHGEEEHGIFLYREAIQVPLLVKLPGSRHAGRTVKKPAGLIDVFPTILEQTATKAPERKSEALSLTALLEADAPHRSIYSETYYPKLHFGWSDLHSLVDGSNHFIRAPIPELYDLTSDPGEKKNVIKESRRAYVAMRAAIEPYVKAAAAPAPIDPDEAAKLAALGYIGSTAAATDDADLPDPKNTIEVFQQIRLAYTHFKDDKLQECLELTERLLKDNHRILDLWDLKSKALAKLGRNEEAIAAAKEGLRVQPSAVALISAVANLSILMGRLDEAQQHAELLAKTDKGQSHELMARIWAGRKDYQRAEKEARLAMDAGRDPTNALMTLGLIAKERGDLPGAMRYLDEALQNVAKKKNPRVPNLHFYRGDVLARLGRNQDAESEFRQEIAMYPRQPDAYASLVLLLASAGRGEEAAKVVFDLIEAAPHPPSYIVVAETLKAIGDDRGAVYWANQAVRRFPQDAQLRGLLQEMTSRRAG